MVGISLGLMFTPGGAARGSTAADITKQQSVSLLANILDIGR